MTARRAHILPLKRPHENTGHDIAKRKRGADNHTPARTASNPTKPKINADIITPNGLLNRLNTDKKPSTATIIPMLKHTPPRASPTGSEKTHEYASWLKPEATRITPRSTAARLNADMIDQRYSSGLATFIFD
jgi:hypothetical protein